MRAATKPLPAPETRSASPVRRNSSHLPGASAYLCARLHGQPQARRDLITDHLPALLAGLGRPPAWFSMHDTSDPHLELCVRLSGADAYGPAARQLGSWAEHLVEMGALGDISLVAYRPQTGRWGSKALLIAAEDVFVADSAVVAQQLARDSGADVRVLAAANVIDITVGFHSGVHEGLSWLAAQPNDASSTRLPRPVQAEAARLVDPRDNWAALRSLPGGSDMIRTFAIRREALASYRALLDQEGDTDTDTVLHALLHHHYLRSTSSSPDPDEERTCLRLARAAALDPRRNHGQASG
ncbi:thiopeptide-type bacteriocin biosynthesis protein [Streptomyces sp. RKAG337]|uniref:thiopeptide-type bacteriocin biosynthesis protein n=1 Tax=Streptomyces sp. RKAG337 TaxID=2893404 RepID=UPI002033F0DD|nr:thiopeptide-type bacteriocin biosynthesis protein [Streptomyces sp. RKAG337]MCM2431036.1 thiopeptide-type bacteriocin biosynthesis protein [Streptomyces sp. RKAG337]